MPTRPVRAVEAHHTLQDPVFFPRDSPSVTAASRSVDAGQAKRGNTGIKKKDHPGIWDVNALARPLEGKAQSSVADGVEAGETEIRKQVRKTKGGFWRSLTKERGLLRSHSRQSLLSFARTK